MGDSLAVERAEMLLVIEHLEDAVKGLRDVNAGVSRQCAEDLQRLRELVLDMRSPSKGQYVLEIAGEIIAKIAAELLKRWM